MLPPVNTRAPQIHKYKKHEKKEHKPFDKRLMKADPNFVDERIPQKEEDKGFFSKLLGI
jgi:hypothetical protein